MNKWLTDPRLRSMTRLDCLKQGHRIVTHLLLCLALLVGAVGTAAEAPRATKQSYAVRWGAGEELGYSLNMGMLQLGTAGYVIGKTATTKKGDVFWFRASGQSNPGITSALKMRGEHAAKLQLDDLLPVSSERKQQIGEKEITVATEWGTPIRQQVSRGTTQRKSTKRIAQRVDDPASMFLLMRTLPLKQLVATTYWVLSGDELYRLQLSDGGSERVYAQKTGYDCRVLKGSSIRVQTSGRPIKGATTRSFRMWLTNDGRAIPVKVEAFVQLGIVTATLAHYRPASEGFAVSLR